MYGNNKEYEIAIDYIDTVTTITPNHPQALYFRGLFKYKKGNLDGAFSDLTKAEKLGVSDATVYLQFINK